MASTTNDILKNSLSTTDYSNNPNLSPIEQKILEQYQLMNNTLIQISKELETLTNATSNLDNGEKGVSVQLVENLRQLETKLVFVYTFFKGAVYSILNTQDYAAEQEVVEEEEEGQGQRQGLRKGGSEDKRQQEEEEEQDVELLGVSDSETQNVGR